VFAGSLSRSSFITIACGALSGFHSLISSAPRRDDPEGIQVRMIGYGAMLVESFVAIMALIAASIIEPGSLLRDERPRRVLGSTVQSASAAGTTSASPIPPEALTAAANAVG